MNSAFLAIWLVPKSRDIKYYSPPGGFRVKKMSRETHFIRKWSNFSGIAIKPVLYILKQLFASVSVTSGGYLPGRSGSVNIHRYSPPLLRIIVNYSTRRMLHLDVPEFLTSYNHVLLTDSIIVLYIACKLNADTTICCCCVYTTTVLFHFFKYWFGRKSNNMHESLVMFTTFFNRWYWNDHNIYDNSNTHMNSVQSTRNHTNRTQEKAFHMTRIPSFVWLCFVINCGHAN